MRVKLCGIRTAADIELLNEFKPDYAGFVFAESKRKVTAEQALVLIKGLNSNIKTVGVFTEHTPLQIAEIADKCGLWGIQFHGAYTEEQISLCLSMVKAAAIKAIRTESVQKVEEGLRTNADFILFDAYDKQLQGGTGKSADLNIIGGVRGSLTKPFFLAGGISHKNAAKALEFNPYAIDVSSGIENADGYKDAEKIELLYKALERI